MKSFLLFLLFSLPALSVAQLCDYVIGIDPGHGGSDSGAPGINGYTDPDEKHFCLLVANELDNILRGVGATVSMTRTSDTYPTLQDRVDFIDDLNPDAFLSIHMNSATSSSANGTEVYRHSSGTDADIQFAQNIQESVVTNTGLTDRGVKHRPFYVLGVSSSIPAVLAEALFISNQNEFNYISLSANQALIAQAYYEGILNFLGPNDCDFDYSLNSISAYQYNSSTLRVNSNITTSGFPPSKNIFFGIWRNSNDYQWIGSLPLSSPLTSSNLSVNVPIPAQYRDNGDYAALVYIFPRQDETNPSNNFLYEWYNYSTASNRENIGDIKFGAFNNLAFSVQAPDLSTINIESLPILETSISLANSSISPNPFHNSIQIEYELEEQAEVGITISKENGQLLFQSPLINQQAGTHIQKIDASNYPSGVYLVNLLVGAQITTIKAIKR